MSEVLGVVETAAAIASGHLTARAATEEALARIDERDAPLNAFSVVLREQALAEAAHRDAAQATGDELGPLHGVPVPMRTPVRAGRCGCVGVRRTSTSSKTRLAFCDTFQVARTAKSMTRGVTQEPIR